ncbi:hypothetical protein BDB01DRAFT_784834 [Pilobolus umbonatus]|nr:hypothetical protein BDB01DRAFT_784834 [Pilobolus umbonatus]
MSADSDPKFVDALKTVKLEDFKEINRIPCARNALLYGMGAGVAVGLLRFVTKRTVSTSANWAVASFCGVSAVSFEACHLERKNKLEKLRLIVKETDSKGREERLVVTERGKKGAFDVVIETPAQVAEAMKKD